MKLSEKERKAVALLRKLHERQRDRLLARMEREVIANRIAMRIGGLRKLKIPADTKVEKAFGTVPAWKRTKPRR